MKRILLSLFILFSLHSVAEDGHQLWLRYQPVNKAKVTTPKQTPVINMARQELEMYYQGESVTLKLDASLIWIKTQSLSVFSDRSNPI